MICVGSHRHKKKIPQKCEDNLGPLTFGTYGVCIDAAEELLRATFIWVGDLL
jgi:hypothetical protein